jgi:azurin
LLEALWLSSQHNIRNVELLAALQKSPEPHARNAAHVIQHLWCNVESTFRGGVLAGDAEEKTQKSGILSDTKDLTTIRIATVKERMMYDVKELTVKPGKKVKLTFVNEDFMPHNLLLVQPGKIDEIANQALVMGAKGFENGFIPDNKNILWHTKLLDAGKDEVVEFNAPSSPGDYPYMCSFPGHHIIMRGVLHVK